VSGRWIAKEEDERKGKTYDDAYDDDGRKRNQDEVGTE